MKLLKLLPLLLMFAFFNSQANAAQDCDKMKGNIVGKLFCNVKSNSGLTTIVTTETDTEKKWKLWKRPEWTKKKK